MVPALTIKEIEKHCGYHYEHDEKRIIGIMIARYSIPKNQDMIKQQYDFWNKKTGHYLNVYWLGYGAYIFPNKQGQFLVGDYGNESSVYFDTNVFVNEVDKLEQYKEINDEIGILLCNFYNGKIHLNESVFFNLEELMENNNQKLRMFGDYLLKLCKKEHDVANATVKLKIKYSFLSEKPTKYIKEAIKLIIEAAFSFL